MPAVTPPFPRSDACVSGRVLCVLLCAFVCFCVWLPVSGCLGGGGSVITALTSQNSRTVRSVAMTPLPHLRDTMDVLKEDLPPRAVKVGMLGNAEVCSDFLEHIIQAQRQMDTEDFIRNQVTFEGALVHLVGRPARPQTAHRRYPLPFFLCILALWFHTADWPSPPCVLCQTASEVGSYLRTLEGPIVVDPVMVSTSGTSGTQNSDMGTQTHKSMYMYIHTWGHTERAHRR